VDPAEAIQHGEAALTSVPAGDVEPLLTRLAALAKTPANVTDIYERQVSRCRAPADKLAALARAAQVAAERGENQRARSFFELALSGGVQDDTISALEGAARTGDERSRAADRDRATAGGRAGLCSGGRPRSRSRIFRTTSGRSSGSATPWWRTWTTRRSARSRSSARRRTT
jgi:hypothetical protein